MIASGLESIEIYQALISEQNTPYSMVRLYKLDPVHQWNIITQ